MLLAVMIIPSLMPVPGQSLTLVGIEVLFTGLLVWSIIGVLDVKIWRKTDTQYRVHVRPLMIINQITLLPYLIGGAMILVFGMNGFYWLVPGDHFLIH